MRTLTITVTELSQAAQEYGIADPAEAYRVARQAYDAGIATATLTMFDTLRSLVVAERQKQVEHE